MRVNFVASVDGGVAVRGRSAGLQTPGDNAVFAALRDLADVVLVGAGTARAEGYRLVRLSSGRQQLRQDFGLAADLPTAVVSRSLTLDRAGGLFAQQSETTQRTIVITCAAADEHRRAALAEVADVVVAGDDEIDFLTARQALEGRGLHRILCEGGPQLYQALTQQAIVDELDLSVTGLLAGPGTGRLFSGPPWQGGPRPLQLCALLEEDGALFTRYRHLDRRQPPPETIVR